MARLWRVDVSVDYLPEVSILNVEASDDWEVTLTKPLGSDFPVLDMEYEDEEPLPDYFQVGPFGVVSQKIKTLVEMANASAEFFAVRMFRKKRRLNKAFFFMHPTQELDCLDRQRSKVIMKGAYITRIKRLVLDESVAGTSPLFRLAKSVDVILLTSDELAQSIIDAGASGVSFVAPETYSSP